MKTDRELLELAAKAAGLNMCGEACHRRDGLFIGTGEGDLWLWNPLADDGDALRLAIKLGLSVSPYPVYEHPKRSVVADVRAHAECPNAQQPLRYCVTCTEPCQRKQPVSVVESYGDDSCAATRRAIVRAAAAIAEEMAPPTAPLPSES